MTNADSAPNTPDPVVPFTNNINYVQLVGAFAVALTMFSGGKYNITPDQQKVIVGAIVGVVALVTMAMHTFVNHKANVAAALKYARKVELVARSGVGRAVILLVLVGTLIAGCASWNASSAQQELATAQTAFNSALAIYNSICMANATAAFCTPADQAEAALLEKGVADALTLAQVAVKAYASGSTSADFTTAITSAEDAINKFDNFVNQLNAEKSAKLAAKLKLGAGK